MRNGTGERGGEQLTETPEDPLRALTVVAFFLRLPLCVYDSTYMFGVGKLVVVKRQAGPDPVTRIAPGSSSQS